MRNMVLWFIWTAVTLGGGLAVSAAVAIGGDRTPLLPGETTGLHHQFETACETCHGAVPLSVTVIAAEELNAACRECHDQELAVSNDSHPRKEFRDARLASYWEKLAARACTSRHIEHKPELTRPGAVTLALDYCVACHADGER